ncbi:metalloregulator ArsR/SmtB family transcription factor [Moraxella sp. FZFQ2102]|uniref:ArsR/SmtB family transcription factor n=1 Tax=Moraxella sp. FZFQ2102 TaxID=2953752 RepID=UPI00209C20C0|nr:metalloregulator ArsR/SmtB family transcription factor [Moraxella sp. FZFQ2102]USZ14868.1 metalloregulator ArsR/SmtB family transcription factor [Moraxella sp. FZFQ2102]
MDQNNKSKPFDKDINFDALPRVMDVLKILANPERLKIVCVLGGGVLNVGEIEVLTGVTQPTLSQQLGILRKSGIVHTQRQGKYVYYCVADQKVVQLIAQLHELYCQ